MPVEELIGFLLDRYPGLIPTETWGETALFYNPGQTLPKGVYFATIKQKDGENDAASNLNRAGVYRLNFTLTAKSFEALFGPKPARPGKGETIVGPWDFTLLDQAIPHPIYAWMGWAAVLNPSPTALNRLLPQLDAGYAKAKRAFDKRKGTVS